MYIFADICVKDSVFRFPFCLEFYVSVGISSFRDCCLIETQELWLKQSSKETPFCSMVQAEETTYYIMNGAPYSRATYSDL